MRWLLGICLLFCMGRTYATPIDSTDTWFPGGDIGFYKYLEDRLMATGFSRPQIDQNGETVYFEMSISDSGYVDSVRLSTCFNYNLCSQLRQILMTLPRLNPEFSNGNTIPSHRVYSLDIKQYGNGYVVDPAIVTPYHAGYSSATLRWTAIVIAVVGAFIIIFK